MVAVHAAFVRIDVVGPFNLESCVFKPQAGQTDSGEEFECFRLVVGRQGVVHHAYHDTASEADSPCRRIRDTVNVTAPPVSSLCDQVHQTLRQTAIPAGTDRQPRQPARLHILTFQPRAQGTELQEHVPVSGCRAHHPYAQPVQTGGQHHIRGPPVSEQAVCQIIRGSFQLRIMRTESNAMHHRPGHPVRPGGCQHDRIPIPGMPAQFTRQTTHLPGFQHHIRFTVQPIIIVIQQATVTNQRKSLRDHFRCATRSGSCRFAHRTAHGNNTASTTSITLHA